MQYQLILKDGSRLDFAAETDRRALALVKSALDIRSITRRKFELKAVELKSGHRTIFPRVKHRSGDARKDRARNGAIVRLQHRFDDMGRRMHARQAVRRAA